MKPADKSILLIVSEFPPNVGGIGNHGYNLAKALQGEGFKVTVLADIIDVNEEELNQFAVEQSFKIRWVRRSKFLLFTYLSRVAVSVSLARENKVVICSGKFSLWLGLLLKTIFPGKQRIAVVHGTELDLKSSLTKKITSAALNCFNKIIAVSNYTKQFLPGSLNAGIKQYVIHNGIFCSEFKIKRNGRLSGQPAMLTVGNLTERKGQENVIKAMPEVLHLFPQAQYHLIGKPTNKEKLLSTAGKLSVADKLHFYGAVNRSHLLETMQGASVKLMLSNHTSDGDFEGFGIAVLEANAFGIPAIGSRNSGIADAIQHNKTGLLVDQYNKKEIANAVDTIISNYSFFSNNAKDWAQQHDWNVIVKEYVAVINE